MITEIYLKYLDESYFFNFTDNVMIVEYPNQTGSRVIKYMKRDEMLSTIDYLEANGATVIARN